MGVLGDEEIDNIEAAGRELQTTNAEVGERVNEREQTSRQGSV